MKKAVFLGIILALGGFRLATAETLQVKKGHVEFLAIGKPSAIKIRGRGQALKSQLQWKDQSLSGTFHFDLDSLDTGIELRTRHMKEKYLETGKYKMAELVLKPVTMSQNPCKEKVSAEKLPFVGTLKLHGVEKPVEGEFDVQAEKGSGSAKARFHLNISDHQIEIPVYMGIKVADKVEHTVDLEWSCAL